MILGEKKSEEKPVTNKQVEENKEAASISYEVSHILAKHCKPLSDWEIVKKCIISAVKKTDWIFAW